MPEHTFVTSALVHPPEFYAENDIGPRSARGSIQSSCATARPLEQLGAAASRWIARVRRASTPIEARV
jgi:hypothetical protein